MQPGLRRSISALTYLVVAGVAVGVMVHAAWQRTGTPIAAPLDDTYIHFQYARSVVDGHPFAYHAGDEPSSGATSPLYVLVLAVPYALGLKGTSLMWGALVIAIAALAVTAWGAGELAAYVGGGRIGRACASACMIGWGWLIWHAASGMEVALCAAAVMSTWIALLRWMDAPPENRTWLVGGSLAIGAIALPFIRPETVALAGVAGVALAFAPPRGRHAGRWLASSAPLALVATPLWWWLVTGRTRTNGVIHKLLLVDPYQSPERIASTIMRHAGELGSWLLGWDGEGHLPPIVIGVVVGVGLVMASWRLGARGPTRWLMLAGVAATLAAVVVPTTYRTFAWHHLRYIYPYVPPLIALGVGVLARVGVWARRYGPRAGQLWLIVPLLVPVSMATQWPEARANYAASSAEIAGQHIELAREIRELPADAVVAVSDTGATAYLGEHHTLDVIGLTWNHAAPYYRAGRGSRFEMFEALDPSQWPSHFALYRDFWGVPQLLGPVVATVTIPEPTVMVARDTVRLYRARHESLRHNELPRRDYGELVDHVDVADIASERRHDYDAHPTGLRRNVVRARRLGGRRVVEGGRGTPGRERFTIHAREGQALRLVGRVQTRAPCTFVLRIKDTLVAERPVPRAPGWKEIAFDVPKAHVADRTSVEIRRQACRAPTSFHWWAFDPHVAK